MVLTAHLQSKRPERGIKTGQTRVRVLQSPGAVGNVIRTLESPSAVIFETAAEATRGLTPEIWRQNVLGGNSEPAAYFFL